MARYFEGELHLERIEFEVDDDADDLEIEQAFNAAVDDRIDMGLDSLRNEYDYREVDNDDDEESD